MAYGLDGYLVWCFEGDGPLLKLFSFFSLHMISRLFGGFDPVRFLIKTYGLPVFLGSPTREFVIRRFSSFICLLLHFLYSWFDFLGFDPVGFGMHKMGGK